ILIIKANMSVEEVTYSALLALGFNSSHIIPKERIPINEVGDCIVYFLFSHIHPQQTSELFRDCWPIHDKKMESQFRNIAYDWFKKLNQSEDFNIKPTLVVSKVVLMPTSNKFLHTVYTLCRFALRTKIRKRDPSFDILFLPHPTKAEQCQKAVQLFMKLKEDHKDRYINLVNEQRRKLQILRSTAQKLVSRYRNSLQVKSDLVSELQTKLNKSCFLEPFEKPEIADCSLNQFESEISKKIKEKSEEIRELWQCSSSYRCKEEIFWPFFENVISGKKCLSYVDGSDYKALEKDLFFKMPFCSCMQNGVEPLSICSKGSVDLLALIKVGNIGLNSLLELAKTNLILNRDLKDQLKKSDNQTECVKVLKKDREEVQMMINTLLPTLLKSVIELKREMNPGSELSTSSYDEVAFGLFPPTPQVNIDKSYRDQPLQTPFRLLELTPDVTERSVSLNLDHSHETLNLKSARRLNASKNISQNVSYLF
ncbi:HAUS augmin-like complex subunit 6, partial [Armadillidium nasatum]